MTDFPVSGFGFPPANALEPSNDDNDSPPNPKPPTWSSSRRLIGRWPSKILSMTFFLKNGCPDQFTISGIHFNRLCMNTASS